MSNTIKIFLFLTHQKNEADPQQLLLNTGLSILDQKVDDFIILS